MPELSKQINISVFSAFMFFVVNLLRIQKEDDNYFCTKQKELFLLTFIFGVMSFFSMCPKIDIKMRLRHSIYGALIFFMLSSPSIFAIINGTLGNKYSSSSGCPTIYGIALSSVLYCLFLIMMMQL